MIQSAPPTRHSLLERLPHACGAELADLVAQLAGAGAEGGCAGLSDLCDADRLEIVKATSRLEAWTAAVRAQAVNTVFESAADLEIEEAAVLAERGAVRRSDARLDGGVSSGGPLRGPAVDQWEQQRWLHRRVATEVSLVLGVSMWAADREVDLARGLAAHPPLRRALAEGRLDRVQALAMLAGVQVLAHDGEGQPLADPVPTRSRVLARLLGPDDSPEGDDFDPAEPAYDVDEDGTPVGLVRELDPETRPDATLWGLVPGRLRAILAREVTRADPAAAAYAAKAARDGRHVSFERQPSFMADLRLHAPADEAGAAWANLDATARAVKAALGATGDDRNLDRLRADIFVGWLTEGAYGLHVTRPDATTQPPDPSPDAAPSPTCLPRPAGPLVHLGVAATTMLGLDREPGILHGPTGPIPVPDTVARQIAHADNAAWQRLLYDPGTGVASDLSGRHRPPRRMAEFVRARDGQVTRHPTSCATHLELDHVRAYDHVAPDRGGPTTSANLQASGHRDHQLKTNRHLTVTGDANRRLTITTRSGRSYSSYPHPYADPDPRAWTDPDPPPD